MSTHLRAIRWAYALTVLLVFGILFLFRFENRTGFTSLIRFGESWESVRVPELRTVPYHVIARGGGYDGQFYAQTALHPRIQDTVWINAMDLPSYRARRILMPLIAHTLGGGEPRWVLQIYAFINPLAWILLAWLLLTWLPPDRWENFARWFFCVASSGAIESLRASLTDLPAACLILAAARCWEQKHSFQAGLLLACAGLTRETSVLATTMGFDTKSSWARKILLVICGVVPVVGWLFYLHQLFPSGNQGEQNFNWPFLQLYRSGQDAVLHLLRGDENTSGRYLFRLCAIFGFSVQAVVILCFVDRTTVVWRIAVPFAVLFWVLGEPVWHGYWAVSRVLLPMTLGFNLLIPKSRWAGPLLIATNLPITLHALERLIS